MNPIQRLVKSQPEKDREITPEEMQLLERRLSEMLGLDVEVLND